MFPIFDKEFADVRARLRAHRVRRRRRPTRTTTAPQPTTTPALASELVLASRLAVAGERSDVTQRRLPMPAN